MLTMLMFFYSLLRLGAPARTPSSFSDFLREIFCNFFVVVKKTGPRRGPIKSLTQARGQIVMRYPLCLLRLRASVC